MIPYELTLRNFMCYRDNLPPLQLDGLHVACLSGENGVGKSALLDAITWALWGKARMSDDELIAQGETEMVVDLCFVLNNQRYRVTRRRQLARSGKRSTGKSSLEFHIRGENGWRSIGENTIAETERKIADVLRMKYETFINASFLLQGRADEFTRKTPGERKQVLADILDLHEYAVLEERARLRARGLGEQIRTLDGAISLLEQEAAKRDLYVQFVAEAEEKVARLTVELAEVETKLYQADEEVRLLEAKGTRCKELQGRLVALRKDQQEQQQAIDVVQQEIADDEAVLQRRVEIAAGVEARAVAERELERVEALRPRYDALREQRRQLQDELKDMRHSLHIELKRYEHEAQILRQQAARRPEIQTRLMHLEQQLAMLDPLVEELNRLRAHRSVLDDQISRVQILELRRTELQALIDQRTDSLVAVREEQKRTLARLDHQLRDVEHWHMDLTVAREQQQAIPEMAAKLLALRKREQTMTEQVATLRAQCEQFKQQADQISKRKALLTDESATTCPLCGSDLGQDGVGTIMSHYDEEIILLRQSYRVARDEANTLDADLNHLRKEVQETETQVSRLEKGATRVESLEQQLAAAQEWQREREHVRVTLDDVERQLETEAYEQDARETLRGVEAELSRLTGDGDGRPGQRGRGTVRQVSAATALEAQRKALQQQQEALEKQLATRPALEGEVAACQHTLEELEQAAENLPAAEQHAAALAATIEGGDFGLELREAGRAVEAALSALGYTPELHTAARTRVQELEHWVQQEQRLEHAQSRMENNRRVLQYYGELLERRAAEMDVLSSEERQLEQELHVLPGAMQRARECKQAVDTCRRTLQAAQRDLYEKQSLHSQAERAREQLVEKQSERQALAERQNVFQELAEAFGKKGVQAMLIETAIPEIERESNRLLSRITGNQMHLTFEMQRNTKKGDISETLEIRIADALGTRTYDAFSGGEATRINFAIRIALSRLLAQRAGASLETLVIDEGMSALDADGRERFIEAITSVQQDFKRILVITHLEEMKDRFPARIEITKTSAGSMWMLM